MQTVLAVMLVLSGVAAAVSVGVARRSDPSVRRYAYAVAGLSVGSRVAIEIGVIFGAVILFGLLASIGSYIARMYLLWGPVWRTATDRPPARRLLYWKARNLLMLLIGAVLLAAFLTGFGVFDTFVQLVVLESIDMLVRVGFAGFLPANIGALREGLDTAKTNENPSVGASNDAT